MTANFIIQRKKLPGPQEKQITVGFRYIRDGEFKPLVFNARTGEDITHKYDIADDDSADVSVEHYGHVSVTMSSPHNPHFNDKKKED